MMNRKKNSVLTLVLWSVLCVICMYIMIDYITDKSVIIADADGMNNAEIRDGEENGESLHFIEISKKSNQMVIPMEEGIKAERVSVENRCIDKEIWIHIKDADAGFLQNVSIAADSSLILGGTYEEWESELVLKVQTKELFEVRSVLDHDQLQIEFFRPKEIYDRIIVVDAAYGDNEYGMEKDGISEKDLIIEIVKRLKTRLDGTNIKVYYTGLEEKEVSWGEKIALANDSNGDMFISICGAEDAEDIEKYGIRCLYNQDFFIPIFGNLELADILERQVVTAVSGLAEGIFPSTDSILDDIQIPGAQLQVGYLTHDKETLLLQQPEYQEKIVDGIIAAIEEGYEMIEGIVNE